MKEKLMSRKLWVALLSNIISIAVIFSDIGGITGTIFGIIGAVLSCISYMIAEGMIDAKRVEVVKDKIDLLKENLK